MVPSHKTIKPSSANSGRQITGVNGLLLVLRKVCQVIVSSHQTIKPSFHAELDLANYP